MKNHEKSLIIGISVRAIWHYNYKKKTFYWINIITQTKYHNQRGVVDKSSKIGAKCADKKRMEVKKIFLGKFKHFNLCW